MHPHGKVLPAAASLRQLRQSQLQADAALLEGNSQRRLARELDKHVVRQVFRQLPRRQREQLRDLAMEFADVGSAALPVQLLQQIVHGRLVDLQMKHAAGRSDGPRRMGGQLVVARQTKTGHQVALGRGHVHRYRIECELLQRRVEVVGESLSHIVQPVADLGVDSIRSRCGHAPLHLSFRRLGIGAVPVDGDGAGEISDQRHGIQRGGHAGQFIRRLRIGDGGSVVAAVAMNHDLLGGLKHRVSAAVEHRRPTGGLRFRRDLALGRQADPPGVGTGNQADAQLGQRFAAAGRVGALDDLVDAFSHGFRRREHTFHQRSADGNPQVGVAIIGVQSPAEFADGLVVGPAEDLLGCGQMQGGGSGSLLFVTLQFRHQAGVVHRFGRHASNLSQVLGARGLLEERLLAGRQNTVIGAHQNPLGQIAAFDGIGRQFTEESASRLVHQ